MADPKGYLFSKDATARTTKAVKAYEGARTDTQGNANTRNIPTRQFRAIIVANTFTDCRYTVGRAKITNDDSDDTDAKIEITEFNSDHPLYFRVTATNLAEYSLMSHTLPVGTPVWVSYDFDEGTENSKPRYWFDTAPILDVSVVITASTDDAALYTGTLQQGFATSGDDTGITTDGPTVIVKNLLEVGSTDTAWLGTGDVILGVVKGRDEATGELIVWTRTIAVTNCSGG